jgi:hypothetical protein
MAFDPTLPFEEVDELEPINEEPIVKPAASSFDINQPFEEVDESSIGTQASIPYQYDKSRFRPKAKTPEEKEVGTIEGITNAAKNAFDSSRQAMDVIGGVTPEEAKNISKIEYDKQSRKLAPGYDEYQKAEGMDAVWAFAKNPIEVTSNIIAEGLAGSLPALGAGLAAGGVGAAAGSVVPVIGTGVGFTAGQIAGTFAGSLATEYGGKILEEMQDEGMDIQDPDSIQKFFSNQTLVDAAKDKALKRGVPIAAFDAISAGIGGKLGRVIGKQFVTKTGEAAAEVGVQAGLGGGGEVAGSLVAGEPIEGKAVFGEVIGEAGPGAAEIVTGRIADRQARLKAQADAKVKAASELSTTLEENNAPLTANVIKSQTATSMEQDKLAADLEDQLDAIQTAPKAKPTKAGKLPTDFLPVETPGATYGRESEIYDVFSGIRRKPLDITQPAEPTAQPPIINATQEIIKQQGVRQEPQDGTQIGATPEAGVSDSLQPPARGEEEGQVIFGLRSVADNTATREQISALSEAGLVDIVKGKPVINEDGAAILAQPAAPAIVEQEPVTTPALEEAVTPAPIAEAPVVSEEGGQVSEITTAPTIGEEPQVSPEIENLIQRAESAATREEAAQIGSDFAELDPSIPPPPSAEYEIVKAISDKANRRPYNADVLTEENITAAKEAGLVTKTKVPKLTESGRSLVTDGARVARDREMAIGDITDRVTDQTVSAWDAKNDPASSAFQARIATQQAAPTITEAAPVEPITPAPVTEQAAPAEAPAITPAPVAETSTVTEAPTAEVVIPKTGIEELDGVVYHGAGTKFDVPDMSMSGKTSGITEEGKAFWVTSNKESAIGFGKLAAGEKPVVNEFRIEPKNPLVVDVTVNDITSGEFENIKIRELNNARKNGNDVVIFKQKSTGGAKMISDEIAVLDKNIIKPPTPAVSETITEPVLPKLQREKADTDFASIDEITDIIHESSPKGTDKSESKRIATNFVKDSINQTIDWIRDTFGSAPEKVGFDASQMKKWLKDAVSIRPVTEDEFTRGIIKKKGQLTKAGEDRGKIDVSVLSPMESRMIALHEASHFLYHLDEGKQIPEKVLNSIKNKKLMPDKFPNPGKGIKERFADAFTNWAFTKMHPEYASEFPPVPQEFVSWIESEAISEPLDYISSVNKIRNQKRKFAEKEGALITAQEPTGIAVGNRVKLGKSPQTYTIEEEIPQTANDKKFGEQYYNVKNEKTGETQVVEKNDMKPVSSRRRKMASEPDPLPENERYGQVKLNQRIQRYFGGKIPDRVYVVDDAVDKEKKYQAAYYPDLGILIVNNAYIKKNANVGDIIAHELGHYAFGDKKFKAAFDNFYNSLSPEDKAKIDKIVEESYNEETEESQIEESKVIAFTSYTIVNPQRRSLWNAVLDALKAFANKVFGKNFQMSDPNRTALAILSTAKKRFAAGEEIVREGEVEGPRMMAVEAEPRTEQVAGRTDRGTPIITTPVGIIKQTNEVLRKNFFDGTTVSDEATKNAWLYISRLLDIESGNANELAGEINDVVDADTNSDSRMGASLFSVSLANYSAKLAALGDSTMLSFLVRRINRMPVDNRAGGRKEAGEALRAAREYDIDGYGALKVEQKAKRDRTAAEIFARGNPTKEQVDAVSDAIDAADNATIGTPEEVASDVEKIEKRTKRNITKKLETLLKKGSLKEMIASIKNTPLEEQQAPGWIEKVIKGYLEQAGLTGDAATTAAKLYDSILSERFVAAKQKAFEETLKRSAPWNNYLSRNSRMAKDSLKKIQVAIRTGVLDPSKTIESVIAKENGWDGFTKEQFEKIVQLDNIINNPDNDDVTRREAMSDLNKIIVDAKLPVRFKDALGAYYVGNALMGIPTVTVNIASPIGFTVRNMMTDIGRYAFTDPARIPIAFESFLDSMRSWYDQTSYAFKNQIYLNDVVEYLQGQNVLRELFDKGKKQWANGEYAAGFVNMAVGMTQITGRVLSSLDQGAIAMLENQNITRYAMEALAANTKGRVPKDKLKEFANMVLHTKRRVIAESIASGMPRDRAGVLADLAVKSEVISALSSEGISPMDTLDASINDALLSVGRNKAITIKGAENETTNLSDEGMLSYLPISFLQTIASGAARQGSGMQIFSKMLYGFALVPARVFHNVAWFSPYGFIRLGVDAYKKSKGQDSPYAMSLQTDAQFKQRLTEAIAGSVVMLGLAALRAGSSDDEDDRQFRIVITGNGPSATTDRQYYDSWNKKWKPYSIHIVVGDTIIPINIGRGGEALFFPIMLAGAMDDWEIKKKQNATKKEPEDLSAMASMLGSSFFALAQRGPYAAFTKPLFDASKDGRVTEELASQAGYFGKTFIPFLGTSVARNITDFINDPVDRSSVEGAIYANTPIVGPWMGAKALNALGQPVRADDWGDKLFKLGVPVVFSFPKNTPMNELNELILKQGSGPSIPTRTNAQKRFGDILTDQEFESYVREYGKVMSDRMFKNRSKLERMKPSDYDDELEKYARGYSAGDFKVKGASDMAVQAVKRMRQ